VIREEVSVMGSNKGYGVNIDWDDKERSSVNCFREG